MSNSTKQIRADALQARRELQTDERATAAAKVCKKVIHSREFLAAKVIACYLPTRHEIDTRMIIQRAWRANKRVFVPVTRRNNEMFFREIRPESTLQRNSLSIWEPVAGETVSPRLLQLVITPTVAFDRQNHRIGMGGGYYDRCFAFLRRRKMWIQPKLVGVAFECQKVEEIRPNVWDIRLSRVFTEAK